MRTGTVFGLLLAAISFAAYGQDYSGVDPYEEFGKRLNAAQQVTPLTSELFGDQISLYNGSTKFAVTDMSIPGNGSLPVALQRQLVIQDLRGASSELLGGFGDWEIDVPYIVGTFTTVNGWQLIHGTVANTNRCSDTTDLPNTTVDVPTGGTGEVPYANIWDGNQLHIPGEDNQELLVNNQSVAPAYALQASHPWVTTGNFIVGCLSAAQNGLPGEAFVATSPSGVQYTFNWAVVRQTAPVAYVYSTKLKPIGVPREKVYLLATHVQDRFGNWVNYTYNGDQLTQITGSDGRTINLQWSGSTISSVTSALGTWSYYYTTDTNGHTHLSTVTAPDGAQWTYAITAGSLITTKNDYPADNLHPPGQCQMDPDPNTGSFTYQIGAPSGAVGSFTFDYERHMRTYVPFACPGDANPNHNYPSSVFDFLDNFTLTSKQITGAGLGTQTWTYAYSSTGFASGYYTASVPWSYNNNAQPYITSEDCPTCAVSEVTTVTSPGDITKYTFGVQYSHNEGQLLNVEKDDLSGNLLSNTASTYVSDSDVGNEPFANIAGQSVLPSFDNPLGNRNRPLQQSVISQDGGDVYSTLNESFDAYARPILVKYFNNVSGQTSVELQTTFLNDQALWVLGIPQELDNVTTGEVVNKDFYNSSNDTISQHWRFGELLKSYAFDSTGELQSFTDAKSNTTTLTNYYRGEPQLISYPDQTSQQLVVNDAGQITKVTDQAGNTTQYQYDAGGRVKEIDYPVGDEVSWYSDLINYSYVTSAERGIPAGHWDRVSTTGNAQTTTYYDAEWRPLLADTVIIGSTGSDISSASGYDWAGRTIFTSYPVQGQPDWSGITSGTRTVYDVLGRVIQTQQDSELQQGRLTTVTNYLSGARKQVTDPNHNVTTTYFQVFGHPSYDNPIAVNAPAGVTQSITRDLYGNPTSITQSGPYGSENDSVTKTLVYDSFHRLCRTTEPESGSTVLAYDAANNLQWSAQGQTITDGTCGQSDVASSVQTVRSYDQMNRVHTVNPPDMPATIYNYDARGNVKEADYGITVQTFNYNTRNLLQAQTLSISGANLNWAIAYHYDSYGHMDAIGYPSYSGISEGIAYSPDPLGRATQVGSYASGITYFPNGQVAGFNYGNGASYVTQQNVRQLLQNFSYGVGGALNISEDLTYDANGNITNVNDLVDGHRTKAFGYDALNRLTSAVANNLYGVESYSYDALNNLRSRQTGGNTLTFNYDASNRLTSVALAGNVVTQFGYDAQGNRNRLTSGGTTTAYNFDTENQLEQIPGLESYLYDAAGRRVVKAAANGNVTSYYFYDHAGQLMFQFDPGSGNGTNYVYLGTKLIAKHLIEGVGLPSTITASNSPNNGNFTLSWGAASRATSYILQESVDGGAWSTIYNGNSTSASISGRSGGNYVYQVQACASTGCSGWTSSPTVGVWPIVPASVSVPSGTVNGTYTVSWAASVSASAYTVQEALNGGAWTTIGTLASTSMTRPGTTTGSYTYRVEASNSWGAAGWSAPSAAVNVNTSYGVVPAPVPTLSVPATNNTGSQLISWTASSPVTAYTLQQSTNGGATWTSVYSGTNTSATLANLQPGSYSYQLQACNSAGGGMACTPWASAGPMVVTLPPTNAPSLSIPSGVVTASSYTVSWTGIAAATSYTLQQQINGGAWNTVQSNTATSWSVSGEADGTYNYRVQACNAGGCGPWSGVGSVTIDYPPSSAPSLSGGGANNTGSYSLSWSSVANATSYNLMQSTNGGANWAVVQSGNATSWGTSGQSSGTYNYMVNACDAGGCSGWSSAVSVVVTIPAPIAINGNGYDQSYAISKGTGYSTIGFLISGSTWQVYGASPAGNTTKSSGTVPATAVTVQYTWTSLGPPSGDADAGGTLTNGASSPTALSASPSSHYTTNSFGTSSGSRGRAYQLRVDFYNAAGLNVSSSNCTLTAETEGSL